MTKSAGARRNAQVAKAPAAATSRRSSTPKPSKTGKRPSTLSAGVRRMLVKFVREDLTAVLLVGQQPEGPSMEPQVVPSVRAVFPRDRRVGLSAEVFEAIGDVDLLLSAQDRDALPPYDGAVWRKLMISMMPAAMLDALADVIACEDLRVHRGGPVTTIGYLMSVAIRRRIVQYALEASGWRLSKVAKELQLGGTGNLLRTIKELGLEPELERARAKGLVRRGGDRRSPAAKIKGSS